MSVGGQAKENLNLITARKPLDSSFSEAVCLPRSKLEELAWQRGFPQQSQQMRLGTSIQPLSLTLQFIQRILFSMFQKLHPDKLNKCRIVLHRNYTCLHSISIRKYS